MNERLAAVKAAFLKAISEDPLEETNRKIFADWLEEHGFDDEAMLYREWSLVAHLEAEAFLDNYARQCSDDFGEGNLTRNDLIRAAHDYLDSGEYLILNFQTPLVAYRDREEFWRHFMVVTCRPVPAEQRCDIFITCAC